MGGLYLREYGPARIEKSKRGFMNSNYVRLQRLKKLPKGLWLFSRLICLKAPYFSTIRPTFTLLEQGRGEATMKKRRAVTNHIGTVHAIAMANLCELVAGVTLEMTLPETHRWIPKSMKINYLNKATTDLKAKTMIRPESWPDTGSLPVSVEVVDREGKQVVTAEIEMYVSLRKPRGKNE